MNMTVNFSSFKAYLQAFPQMPNPISDILASDSVRRIKEIALSIFSKISNFLSNYNSESAQPSGSVKSIGMLGFISVSLLLLISFLRNRRFNVGNNGGGILPPPTPRREPI